MGWTEVADGAYLSPEAGIIVASILFGLIGICCIVGYVINLIIEKIMKHYKNKKK